MTLIYTSDILLVLNNIYYLNKIFYATTLTQCSTDEWRKEEDQGKYLKNQINILFFSDEDK